MLTNVKHLIKEKSNNGDFFLNCQINKSIKKRQAQTVYLMVKRRRIERVQDILFLWWCFLCTVGYLNKNTQFPNTSW